MAEPFVVVVDDETTKADAILASVTDVIDAVVVDSTSIDTEDVLALLTRAHLVLVDQGLTDLGDREPPTASNGLALIGVLREFLATNHGRHPSFALFSNRLDLLSELPQEARAHVLARSHNFEWALSKNTEDNPAGLEVVISSLATGSLLIEEIFQGQRPARAQARDEFFQTTGDVAGPPELELLHRALKLPETPWQVEASRQIELARPPIYTLNKRSTHVSVRRWLLHRVIPYPTFLYGVSHIAARLALPVDVTAGLLTDKLSGRFAAAEYSGAFHDLDGPRYWRAGADLVIDELGGGEADTLQSEINRIAGREMVFIDHPRPVVTLGADWKAENRPVPPSETVRVQLDDWPAHADPARVRISRVTSPDMAAIVVESDRDRLPARSTD